MNNGGAVSELKPQKEKEKYTLKDLVRDYMAPKKSYNPNEGMEWNYTPDKFNLMDYLPVLNAGRNVAPRKPLQMVGLDKGLPLQSGVDIKTPQELNYEEIKRYNPYVAEQYLSGKLSDWKAQRVINNGNYND